MKKTEFALNTYDGKHLYACEWEPDGKTIGTICLVHGLGEHCGRYDHVARACTDRGFTVLAFDGRGHGKSIGKRGCISSYEVLMDDIDMLISRTRKLYPEIPCFLYGHSLGGNLVLNYVLRRKPDITGVIATSPWLKILIEPSPFLKYVLRFMNSISPAFSVSNNIDASLLSHDTDYVESYRKDELVHAKISVRLFLDAYKAGKFAMEHSGDLKLPLLLMHGTGDAITLSEGSRQFAEKVTGDITFKLWEGLYHELHNEVNKYEVIEFMLDWVESHSKV